MKNITLALLAIVALSSLGYAVSQPNNIGLVRLQVSSGTVAQIDQTTPQGKGELVFCTDCVQSALCVSSGTSKGAYTVSSSSHSLGNLGTMVHCR